MNETRKIEDILHKESFDSEYISMNVFMQEFDSYMHHMKITGAKKQLVMYPGDSLPCIVNINGFALDG